MSFYLIHVKTQIFIIAKKKKVLEYCSNLTYSYVFANYILTTMVYLRLLNMQVTLPSQGLCNCCFLSGILFSCMVSFYLPLHVYCFRFIYVSSSESCSNTTLLFNSSYSDLLFLKVLITIRYLIFFLFIVCISFYLPL